MTLTAPQRKALEILRDFPEIGADGFASKMWPQQPGRRFKRGMAMAAGSYIGKLKKKGWARDSYRRSEYGTAYELTAAGQEKLNEPDP